jgi:hypothetical protein
MKAFKNPNEDSSIGWPHPSLCGEVGSALRNRDEHSQTGILTSASNLTPAFPSFRLVALGVCSRYSGATVPDSHRVPRHLTAISGGNFSAGFKERFLCTPNKFFAKQNFPFAENLLQNASISIMSLPILL